jgi:tetratricopeptide (TPR) repeat protein
MKRRNLATCMMVMMLLSLVSLALAQDAEQYIAVAEALAADGMYEEAIAQLDGAISGYSGTNGCAEAHVLKGAYLELLDRSQEALAQYKTVLQDYYETAAAARVPEKVGLLYGKLRDIEGGLVYVGSVIEANPANGAAKKARWEVMRRAKRSMTIGLANRLLDICGELAASEADPTELANLKLAAARCIKGVDQSRAIQILRELSVTSDVPQVRNAADLELAAVFGSQYNLVGNRRPTYSIRVLEEVIASGTDSEQVREAKLQLAKLTAAEDPEQAFALFKESVSGHSDDLTAVSALNGMVSRGIGSTSQNAALKKELAVVAGQFPGAAVGSEAERWARVLPNPVAPDVLHEIPVKMLVPLANAYSRLCRFDELEAVADELMSRGEDQYYGQGATHKAGLHSARGEDAEAVAVYEEALQRYPNGSWVLSLMHAKLCVQRRLGDFVGP